jgi:hypothetical protein
MTPEELNQLLESTRDQKFRKQTEGRIKIANNNLSRPITDTIRKKISAGLKGRDVYWNDKIRDSLKGKEKSQSHKENLKKSALNKPPASLETRKKISEKNTGQKRTEETCEKIRQMRLGKSWTEETKSKLSKKKRENSKGFVTPEGIFECRAEAVKQYNQKNNSNGGADYYGYRKTRYPDQYYYISREEYLRLTKK